MTHIDANDGAAVLVRAADAEVIGFPPQTVDTFFDDSPAWWQARGGSRPGSPGQSHLTNHAPSKGFR
jgi:hypothetical protein